MLVEQVCECTARRACIDENGPAMVGPTDVRKQSRVAKTCVRMVVLCERVSDTRGSRDGRDVMQLPLMSRF
jgi:hypothetical protein